jgi:hypothetical protein
LHFSAASLKCLRLFQAEFVNCVCNLSEGGMSHVVFESGFESES